MYLSVSEAADEMGTSKSTVKAWIRDGLVSHKGPDGETLVDADDLESHAEALDEEDED